MKTFLVQLESHDDVISVRDKISWGKARRVLLVWPRYGNILERRVDLLLLARHCQLVGAQMAIVTQRSEVKHHARALGIPVFNNPERAQKSAWRRPDIKKTSWRSGKPVLAQVLRQQREQIKISVANRHWLETNRWVRLALFMLAVVSFLFLVLSFAPAARVYLTPERQTQELLLTLWANPEIQAPNPSGGLPAHPLSVIVEGRAQIESSGYVFVPDHFAVGQVELTNLTDQSLYVPVGSIVLTRTSQPVRFMTTMPVTLPAGPGTNVSVGVRAVVPGRSGNVASGLVQSMEGSLGLRLRVVNLQPLTGGSDRRTLAPSNENVLVLRKKLLTDLQGMALEELYAQMLPDQRLLENSLRVRTLIQEDQEPEVNVPGESLQLTMRVEYEGWFVEEKDLEMMARIIMDASLPENFEAIPGSFQIVFTRQFEPEGSVDEPITDSVRWEASMKRLVEATWEDSSLIQLIQGRRVEYSVHALQEHLPLAAPPQIELYPTWWGRLPFLPVRIELVKQ